MADQTAVAEQNAQNAQAEAVHKVVHIELPAANPAESAAFYGDLFGWKMEHAPGFDYWMWAVGDGTGGGFLTTGSTETWGEPVKPGDVLLYVSTPDINETLAKVEALGGRTLVPRMPIPGMGWFAIFIDPAGNRCGLYSGDASAA